MPAEWEQHECCWMQWPHDKPEFNSYAEVPTWSHFDIEKGRTAWAKVANAISNFEQVKMIVHPNNIANASKILNEKIEILKLFVSVTRGLQKNHFFKNPSHTNPRTSPNLSKSLYRLPV